MSTTDETKAQGDGAGAGRPPKRQPGWVKPAKRYGPIVVVVALIGAAVLVFGGGRMTTATTKPRPAARRPARRS